MSQPTPLSEPVLEDVDYELWGQNAKMDCYSKAQMLAYGKAEYERGLEDAAQWWENNHTQWDDDVAKCIRTLKGKP